VSPKTIQLISMGSPPVGLLKELPEAILANLGLAAVFGTMQLPEPTYAFNKDRKQYHTNAIVRRLATLAPQSGFLFALTNVDVFIPESPFVFGEADRNARVGLLSVARLMEHARPEVLKRRAQVEFLHQTGHLAGLSFCEDARCAMFLATNVADCDKKNLALCNTCRNELAKLNR
jgi:archaemetzincin